MKRIFALLIIIFPALIYAQNDTIPKPFIFEQVDSLTGLEPSEIYSKAKIYITERFQNSKHMTQLDDLPSNTLIVKSAYFGILLKGKGAGTAFGAPMDGGEVFFDIKIQAKDDKYKITLYRFFHDGGSSTIGTGGNLDDDKRGFMMSKKQWHFIKERSVEKSLSFIADFKKAMHKNDDF